MIALLVSVITAAEVAAAVGGGADIVDVKDPREGSLGAPRPDLIRAVRALTPPERLVSAAIGDMPHLPGTAALAGLAAATCGAAYVKVGLRGSRCPADALDLIQAVVRAVADAAPSARVIATAYADGAASRLLPPHLLPEVAAAAGAHGCMLDTLSKGTGGLRAALSDADLRRFVDDGRRWGLLVALAGSLTVGDLPFLAQLAPDIVGVRGAACAGGRRSGQVEESRVAVLKAALGRTATPLSLSSASADRSL